MGDAVWSGGHLCIDLTYVKMSGNDLRSLVSAVQATVVEHLARQSLASNVVTISMMPTNNGFAPIPTPPEPPYPPDASPGS